ncbi:MAG TPA: hypothetical protein VFJ58_10705, partial [Armatimonadota bacterium]|nr:hypothetical protein [Armatimonadota bacterium]
MPELCTAADEVWTMAEAKRRSEVKRFSHRTIYPESQRPVQTNLFGDALLDLNRDLPCKLVGVSAPPTGTRVSV